MASTDIRSPDSLRRILIADDEHLVAVDMAEHVTGLGYEVVGPVPNGKKAVQLAKESDVDLALLDVRMPEMDGLEAAGVLYCQMNIPVVIVSAFADKEYLEVSAKIGIFGYLLKPVGQDDLRAALQMAWSGYTKHSTLRDRISDLQVSLDNRITVERAKGILMNKKGLSEEQAMKALQQKARSTRRRLVDLAKAIIEASELMD